MFLYNIEKTLYLKIKVYNRKGDNETYGRKLTKNESLYLILKSGYHHKVMGTAWEVFKDYLSKMWFNRTGISGTIGENVSKASQKLKGQYSHSLKYFLALSI